MGPHSGNIGALRNMNVKEPNQQRVDMDCPTRCMNPYVKCVCRLCTHSVAYQYVHESTWSTSDVDELEGNGHAGGFHATAANCTGLLRFYHQISK